MTPAPLLTSTGCNTSSARARLPELAGFLSILLASILAWSCRAYFSFGSFNDDAGYWLQAQCLTGQRQASDFPYGVRNSPTFGQAVFLSLPCKLGGGSITLAQAWMCATAFVTACLVVKFARRFISEPSAWLIGLLYVLGSTSFRHQTTLMADGTLAFFVFLYLCLRPSSPSPPSRWLWAGLLAGTAFAVRFTGLALGAAEALCLLRARGWKRLGWFSLGYLGLVLPLQLSLLLVMRGTNVYFGEVAGYGPPFLQAQWNYWSSLPAMLAGGIFGLISAASAIGTVLILGCLLGIRRAQAIESGPTTILFVLLFLAGHSLWPFPDSRYYITLYVLVPILALASLPRKAQVWAALVLVSLSLPALTDCWRRVQEVEPLQAVRPEIYQWIGLHEGADKLGSAIFDMRVAALTGRRCDRVPPANQTSELLAALVQSGTDWLLLEPAPVQQSAGGPSLLIFPAHCSNWLVASSLVKVVHQTPWGIVFEIQPLARSLLRSYPIYLRAGQCDWQIPEQRERAHQLLRRALAVTPDFPEARELLASLLLESHLNAQANVELEKIISQYPFALAAIYNRALSEQSTGKDPKDWIRRGLAAANELEDRAFIDLFRALQSSSSARP